MMEYFNEPRAYSQCQFAMSDFDASGYKFADKEGTFTGTLECKRWGRHNNMLVYLELDNGDKIIASVWQNTNYLNMDDFFMGCEITATFEKSKNGKIYLRKVE